MNQTTKTTLKFITLLLVISLIGVGCKKKENSTNPDRDFGYAKVTIDCAGKCQVSYGTADKLTSLEVDRQQAIYYIRYQRNYNLVVNVTPLDVDQNIILNVYSREEKQIFRNAAVRKVGEVWNTQVFIP